MNTSLPRSASTEATENNTRYDYVDSDRLQDVYIGPVDPFQFIQKYFPDQRDDMPSFTGERQEAFVKVGAAMAKENEDASEDDEEVPIRGEVKIYESMMTTMAPYCPHFDIKDIYSSLVLCAKGSVCGRDIDLVAMGLHVELKGKVDPFDDDSPTFEPESKAADQIRGQMASYAGAQMGSQFRTHCFSVWVKGNMARLIRWDRGGVVVTRKFDYTQEPWLAKFLWCFDGADIATQGYDTSVSVADKHDKLDAPRIQEAKCVLGLSDDVVIVRFRVYDEKTKSWRHFYGPNLVNMSSTTPIGRCTRGFEVIDENGKKVYLKDTWRIVDGRYKKESDVYHDHLVGIKWIPKVAAAGDVDGKWQRTVSHAWLSDKVWKERFLVHRHHFIVFEDVGTPLAEFKDTRELVSAMRDALQAHTDAYERGILHRDISTGNILIKAGGGGMLIDWEFAKLNSAPIMERTGTWQFMSVHLLKNSVGSVEHTLLDDLESFFHVLCYIVLVRCEHGLNEKVLKHDLRTIYDECFGDDGDESGETMLGGMSKGVAMRSFYIKGEAKLPDGPLRDLLVELEQVFAARYINPPSPQQRKKFEQVVIELNLSETVLESLQFPVWVYDRNMAKLNQASRWMLDLFDQALKDPRGLTTGPVIRPYIITPYVRVRKTIHAMSENPGASGTAKRKRDNQESQGGPDSKKIKEDPRSCACGSQGPRSVVSSGARSRRSGQAGAAEQ